MDIYSSYAQSPPHPSVAILTIIENGNAKGKVSKQTKFKLLIISKQVTVMLSYS